MPTGIVFIKMIFSIAVLAMCTKNTLGSDTTAEKRKNIEDRRTALVTTIMTLQTSATELFGTRQARVLKEMFPERTKESLSNKEKEELKTTIDSDTSYKEAIINVRNAMEQKQNEFRHLDHESDALDEPEDSSSQNASSPTQILMYTAGSLTLAAVAIAGIYKFIKWHKHKKQTEVDCNAI